MMFGFHIIAFTGNVAERLFRIPPSTWSNTTILLAAAAPTIATYFGALGLRVKNEERMLAGAFGKEWIEYTRETPYQLVPGLW